MKNFLKSFTSKLRCFAENSLARWDFWQSDIWFVFFVWYELNWICNLYVNVIAITLHMKQWFMIPQVNLQYLYLL